MIGELRLHKFLSTRHVRRILGWAALDSAIISATYACLLTVLTVAVPLNYSSCVGFVVFIICIMLVLNYLFGVYHRIWATSSGHEVGVILKAGGGATLITLIAHALPWQSRSIPLNVVVLGNGLSLVGFVTARYRGRLLSGFVWRWRAIWYHEFPTHSTRVLIVGAGKLGQVTAWRLKHGAPTDTDYCILGFVDGDTEKHGMYVEGCQVLGDYKAIPRLVRQYQIELIVIALQTISGPLFREILTCCEDTNARIKVMPDIFELLNRKQGVPFLRDVTAEDFLGRKPVGKHPAVDLTPVTQKIVLVTGAAGSIGSELSRQLLTLDQVKLLVLDNNESDLHDLTIDLRNHPISRTSEIIPILADVTNRVEMKHVFEHHKPQLVFHSAAYKHVPMLEYYPNKALDINVNGTRCVAELSRIYGVERFVLISSDKAVCPINIMGATKRICELLMIALTQQGGGHTLFTAVRFGNVLGSRGSVMPIFNRQIDAGGPVTVTDRNMRRYFMTIAEAANLVIHAACLTKGGDIFMLSMGNEVGIVDLAERMIRMRGLRPYEDVAIEFVGIRPGEKLSEELHMHTEIPGRTLHPDIFQLADTSLKLEPEEFLSQIDALQSVRFFEDDRLRIPLIATARLERTAFQSEVVSKPASDRIPTLVPDAIVDRAANLQALVSSTNKNRSRPGKSMM